MSAIINELNFTNLEANTIILPEFDFNIENISFLDDISYAKMILEKVSNFSRQLNITDEDSYEQITKLYKRSREWIKQIESKRKDESAPSRNKVACINEKAKTLTDLLEHIINIANVKGAKYQQKKEESRIDEERRTLEQASMLDIEIPSIFSAPIEKISSQSATMVKKTFKRFKITDISKVPAKYLTIEEKLVDLDLRLGLSEIPGLEIWEETVTQLRAK